MKNTSAHRKRLTTGEDVSGRELVGQIPQVKILVLPVAIVPSRPKAPNASPNVPQKKSHLGSSDLAADGTVYFNGQHEDTTCITTRSPLRECVQYPLFNCVTHIARVVHCVAKLYLASTVAIGMCHIGATLYTPIRQISLPASSTLS